MKMIIETFLYFSFFLKLHITRDIRIEHNSLASPILNYSIVAKYTYILRYTVYIYT